MARARPQSVNQPIPSPGPEYNRTNEDAVRRQLGIALDVIQRRLTALEVLLNQQPAISNPTGGATVDSQARTAIIAILDALRELTLIEP
jgi:hypothetical protein